VLWGRANEGTIVLLWMRSIQSTRTQFARVDDCVYCYYGHVFDIDGVGCHDCSVHWDDPHFFVVIVVDCHMMVRSLDSVVSFVVGSFSFSLLTGRGCWLVNGVVSGVR
jgi:hypothetical protein